MIRVFIIDDSAVVRQVLAQILNQDPEIEIIGFASDPIFASEKLSSVWPDVFILDVEMPRMDGISFLKKIMSERPTPVIICSSLAEKESKTAILAMKLGAIDIIEKPKVGLKNFLEESEVLFTDSVRAASASGARIKLHSFQNDSKLFENHKQTKADFSKISTTDKLIAIGTSTGGTQALEYILTQLNVHCPGIVIVQHMPEKFTETFANRLNQICEIQIKEAKDGDRIQLGSAYIAPGNKHMEIYLSGAQFHVRVLDGPLINRHRPSVDVLFNSVAKVAGKNAKGIIMTGMGNDGANGLLKMKQTGAFTIAQDETSCVVFGMPKEAILKGAVDTILPLSKIVSEVQYF
ncbi:chemotaxis response regulator protein-glutamate methylesterase [Leptospira borgpetersenii serovar Hardjo-bovis]|uniref:Protein-glutamate methylesterase/protein-glutamine glutaminase n=1 Tax=Leptospira borgpetersenii serovar Hardjo-bovis str. Sponselee TaxID=1303729 RepID=M6BQN6_LEPBO|nr:chemotaxis response regulator protein-glutamate methylesterase [Leptospira borgpetersenii]ABJ78944.1 Chemotaxis response regulator containing a CheY- like receiver domain and a methylesterase domain [Leptospira borgpetersenii serovar Hardjo-bovis str. L550]AMX58226.1 chemotaxis protein CheY [Leptospira borgpetersenii serovar Hardjo]AMX61478.1 chemotaxis protein CheY [Leptospira borgpetersenii serovar Hardjo]AMX64723.1 chemotaxis protein CheY [Leptospira borgpetersenii serovar Hardjo]AMX6793